MKTVQVEDLTWKTLQEMKLAWGLSTLNAVIDRLILSSVHKESKTEVKE